MIPGNESANQRSSKSLPKLIFAEVHCDPATTLVLSKALHRLNAMGYDCFIDEAPPLSTPQLLIERHTRYPELLQNKLDQLQRLGVSIPDKDDRYRYLKNYVEKNRSNLTPWCLDAIEDTLDMLLRNRATSSNLTFYKELLAKGFKYIAGDISCFQKQRHTFEKGCVLQESSLVQHYQDNSNVIAITGLLHVGGIQRIINSKSYLSTKDDYIFFYCHSDTECINEKELAYRDGRVDLPIPIINLNVNSIGVDGCISKIIGEVRAKLPPSSYFQDSYNRNITLIALTSLASIGAVTAAYRYSKLR